MTITYFESLIEYKAYVLKHNQEAIYINIIIHMLHINGNEKISKSRMQ